MDFGSEVKDDAGYLGEEKGGGEKEDDLADETEKGEEKDFEEDRNKGDESEGDIGQELSDDKKESEWDEIDWNEDTQDEREKTEWDEIDWNEDMQGEREKTVWDEIEWNEDLQEKTEKTERNNNDDYSEEQIKEEYVENVESQSTSTVLTSELEDLDNNTEHHEQEEEITEILSEEYQQDTELNVNTEEIEFIEKLEKLAEYGRETTKEGEKIEPQVEKEHAAYYAEEYYAKLKEKGVFNDQTSKQEEEAEQLKQEVTEELKGEHESDNSSDKLEEEDINEESEENMSLEEFEYLWEIRDNLDQEGKSPEEIEEIMHEAEKMYETLKNAEKLYEEQEQEKLKLVDHENEESEEDQKEELDRVDLLEKTAELEEELIQQQKSQEEIDIRVEEAIETIRLEEELELKIEKERAELRNIEDEENLENLKEDLDRVDLIEQSVELEEKLVRQGKLQEEIDTRVEEAIEETLEASEFDDIVEKLYKEQERKKLNLNELEDEEVIENLAEDLDKVDLIEHFVDLEEITFQQEKSREEIDVSERLEEICPILDPIEGESEQKEDLLRERIKIESEEAEVEEDDRLQELYRQEMGKRPIYSKKKTKGYIQWLEQREIREEKIRNSQTETETKKEIEDEDWKKILKKWINEASKDECSAELKSELKKVLESYNNFEDLTRKFFELYEKSQNEILSEKEKRRMASLLEKLQEFDPIQLELLANVRAIKKYIIEQYGWDSMNRFLDYRVRNKFFGQISQKKLKLNELINVKNDISQKPRVFVSNRSSSKQYEKPKERIKIKDYGFRLIRYMLNGHTSNEISKVINYDYDSLINKKYKISRVVFNKLRILMNVDEIPHEIYIGNKVKIVINEEDDISELIGVMLGDGNLGLDGSKVAITLNRIDEEMYVKYIIDKLKTVFHDKQPIQSRNSFGFDIKPSKAVEITCFSKNLHYFFTEKGLLPGDKVKNQVNVPDCVFKKRISTIECIKGLFDTDGTIHVQMKNGGLRLVFTNGSRPLVEDFKRICNNLGINTGKVLTSFSKRNGVQLTSYNVQIASKKHVQKFLRIIDPEKIKEPYRRIYLGTRLILANATTDLINISKKEIQKWNVLNKQKTLIYNKENTVFLRDLCERLFSKKGITEIYGLRFKGKFNDKMFDRALNAALIYAPNHLKLKKSSKDIYHFPPVLRNQLCQYLFKILINSSTQFSTDELIEVIKQKIIELRCLDIYEASTSFIYGKSITNYFKSLIFLIRYLILLSKSSTPVVAKKVFDDIDNNPNWNQVHSYDIVREIIYNLIKTFPAHLNIKEIESNKIIEHLKVKGTVTKQEIAKIIGKGLRAAYNKLIELEKKGIVKRNREKIGDPTFWSLVL